jgi:hypothetical protein
LKIEVIAAPGLHRPDEQIEWLKREKPRPAVVTLQPWDLALPGMDEEEDEEEPKTPAKAAREPRAARGRGRENQRGRGAGEGASRRAAF